ncbi:hypothetical protein L227DRAFT_620873 [Lentinus tigrinus ALCF2SS1-6]|uniref:Uncharacterized protein n=1 Tax=Lentinus tigrinus ALCF2SS1-6 TaxID=1328759 RepID=A0A5C2RQ86_9APHY|nr:hypothetical protein L227DRAFT_620873 [Lentinus tigrinus ALCF2SS1-6]
MPSGYSCQGRNEAIAGVRTSITHFFVQRNIVPNTMIVAQPFGWEMMPLSAIWETIISTWNYHGAKHPVPVRLGILQRVIGGRRRVHQPGPSLSKVAAAPAAQPLNASTEAAISEVLSLFRFQFQESAARGLDDSQMDGRGEFDFELLKGIIYQSHEESRAALQREITALLRSQPQPQSQASVSREHDTELKQLIEDLSNRTISTRIQVMETSRAPLTNHEHLLQDLFQKLLLHIAALRAEPIDYDILTTRLAHAVEPNNIASDKGETAGLIFDRLVPIIPSLELQINSMRPLGPSDHRGCGLKLSSTLPKAMVEATKVLQNAYADFSARDTSQEDSEETRRLMSANAELQIQLAKARGPHAQGRVEKDMLNERVKAVGAERDRLHSRLEALQNLISIKAAETVALEAKNVELKQALAPALERLKDADVKAQSQTERITVVEKSKDELTLDKQQLKAKVDANELKELRCVRDRSKVLEGERAALQRRVKEYENNAANYEKIDGQNKLRNQIAALEAQFARLQAEVDTAKKPNTGPTATARRSLSEQQDAPSATPRLMRKYYLRPRSRRHAEGSAQRHDK